MTVRCQDNGWMDDTQMVDWVKNVWGKCPSGLHKKSLLVLDAFRCHKSDRMKEMLKEEYRTTLTIIAYSICRLCSLSLYTSIHLSSVHISVHHLHSSNDLCPQCCIPSLRAKGSLVLEKKIFKRFLPYMGVVAILVMWPQCGEQTLFSPA